MHGHLDHESRPVSCYTGLQDSRTDQATDSLLQALRGPPGLTRDLDGGLAWDSSSILLFSPPCPDAVGLYSPHCPGSAVLAPTCSCGQAELLLLPGQTCTVVPLNIRKLKLGLLAITLHSFMSVIF